MCEGSQEGKGKKVLAEHIPRNSGKDSDRSTSREGDNEQFGEKMRTEKGKGRAIGKRRMLRKLYFKGIKECTRD